jgi:competence protein ComEC
MRLPAVAIACAFASGIAIGLWPGVAQHELSPALLRVALLSAILLITFAAFLSARDRLYSAAIVSLSAWIVLGACGAVVSNQPKPTNYILNIVDRGEIDLHTPLRWRGVLRDEPAALPGGTAYDINLTSVDFEERSIPTKGGLRVSYSPHGPADPFPDVHVGDRVAVVTQARLPQLFRDEGAFDRRAYLRAQGVDLTATLRSAKLLQLTAASNNSPHNALARLRRRLRESLAAVLPNSPDEAAVLRAMLLGDRSFLDRSESVNFQKTGVFHVLVVAGLHVGAFAAFLFWLARKLRLSRIWTSLAIILCVICYVAVVEQRPPVLRAALMTFVVILALLFFRRVELLNSVAVAALIFLVASPSLLADSSFQLSFLSMFCIAALALPWLEETIEPFTRGMRGWRDVTRDVSHPPNVAQFRIDMRSISAWFEAKVPGVLAARTTSGAASLIALVFHVAEMIVLTLVLQIGMLPLLARDFHRVTLSGPLANLFAVPLTGILVPLGFATLAASTFSHGAASILARPLRWLTALLIHGVNTIAHIPRWSYRIPAPPLWLILFFFGLAIAFAFALRTESPGSVWIKRFSLALLLSAAAAIAIFPFSPRWQHGSLELTVLDVGQGDSLLLVSPSGHTILIDAGGSFDAPAHRGEVRGPDPGEDAVSPYLWSRGFKQIDVVALTHAHQDHLGGLTAIFENFKVKTLWLGRDVASPQQKQLEALAISKGTRVIHELRGNHLDWDGAQTDFLWPQIVPEEIAQSAKNDDSLVFRVSYGDRSFLLPGDAEKLSERSILAESDPQALRSDILKIGHHGSKNSSTPDFLAAVQPRLAVISSGAENPYGHPAPQLLERLQLAGIATLRTDASGAVHILTDGKQFEVWCFVACPEIATQLNSTEPQAPQNQQSNQQK